MSHTETIKGKLRLITSGKEAIESWTKLYLANYKGIEELPSYYKSYAQYLVDDDYAKFIIIEDTLYEIYDYKDLTDEDISVVTKISDTEYEFLVQFYNGACGIGEAIEYAFENLEK